MVALTACNNASIEGSWVETVPGMPGMQQGFVLDGDGSASSINMATLKYEAWKKVGNRLLLSGTSIGNHHQGQHPRMGAVDVVPFIPIRGVTMEEAVALSKEVGEEVARRYNLPVFLYEKSASAPHRENLAAVRKGEFEGMAEKIKLPEWHPDFGPAERHPTAGTVAIGARMPLVAYNINLNTPSLEIAHDIAKKIRFIGGGLRYCKAMGVELKDRGITQVSINMTDYTRTALYRAFELVRVEARRYGVSIVGSEIIGLVPMEALIDTASYYLGLENFSMEQVLEARM